MADNVAITAGTGTSVATDDVAGVHYQRVKISDGTDGATTPLDIVAEDAAHSSGDTGIIAMAVRQDTAAALATTDADYTPLITDANGRLHVLDQNSAAIKTAVEALDNAISGSEMQVDVVGALPAGNNNIGDVDVASIAAGDNNIGNVDIASIAAGDNNIGNVDIASALPAGTNAIGKLAANSGVDIGDVDVTSIAAGSNTIGNTRDAGPSWTTVFGVSGAVVTSADASTATAVTDAPTAGQKLVITDIFFSVGAAMTVAFEIETAGTEYLVFYCAANSSYQYTPRGKFKLATADKKLMVDTSGAGNISVKVSYYSEA